MATVLPYLCEEERFLGGDCDGNGVFGRTPTEAIIGLTFTFH